MNTVMEDLLQQSREGNVAAQYSLALKYYQKGEQYDPQKGLFWMRKSASAGHLKAQKALGLLFSSNQHAPYPEEDPQEAFRMYQLAAQQDDGQAQFWLGQCYRLGYGTEASEEEAKRWIGEARVNGYEEGQEEPLAAQPERYSGNWEFSKKDERRSGAFELEEPEEEKRRSPAIREADEEEENVEDRLVFVKTGLIFAGLGALAGAALAAILVLLLSILSGGSTLTGPIFLGLIILGLCGGFYYGYSAARQKAVDRKYFRGSPFYHHYGKDYELLRRSEQNAYEIYVRLSKIFTPVSYREPFPHRTLFGSDRGYMIPHMLFPGRGRMTEVDLLVLSEKAIYVITTSGVTGTVSGDAGEQEWCCVSRSGRTRYMANPLQENSLRIQTMKDALRRLMDGGQWIQEIPIYSIVCFDPKTIVGEITGLDSMSNAYVMACGGEKMRSFIEGQESRLTLFNREMRQVIKAVRTVLARYPENRTAAEAE